MKYLYKQTGIVVESDDVLDSTMFKPIIEEKTEDLIEDSETETGVAEVKYRRTCGRARRTDRRLRDSRYRRTSRSKERGIS